MESSKNVIKEVELKYQEYLEKMNLTDAARIRTLQLLNQTAILHLMANKSSLTPLLEPHLQQVINTLNELLKNQNWISMFSKSSQVVTLDKVWTALSEC